MRQRTPRDPNTPSSVDPDTQAVAMRITRPREGGPSSDGTHASFPSLSPCALPISAVLLPVSPLCEPYATPTHHGIMSLFGCTKRRWCQKEHNDERQRPAAVAGEHDRHRTIRPSKSNLLPRAMPPAPCSRVGAYLRACFRTHVHAQVYDASIASIYDGFIAQSVASTRDF